MPEGHTIHRRARDIGRDLAGSAVHVSSPQGRFRDGARLVDGSVLEEAEAYGKHLFLWWSTGQALHVHLGLIGKWRRHSEPVPEPAGTVRVRLADDAVAWDLIGPNVCSVVTDRSYREVIHRLGPDPLRDDVEVETARTRFARSSAPVGTLLLDQSAIAGVGNVYRAEILFLVGINPRREARSLSNAEFDLLWKQTQRQLRSGVTLDRIVTVEPRELGRPKSRARKDERLYVYKRRVCRRCGGRIDQFDLGGRLIWVCPACQPG